MPRNKLNTEFSILLSPPRLPRAHVNLSVANNLYSKICRNGWLNKYKSSAVALIPNQRKVIENVRVKRSNYSVLLCLSACNWQCKLFPDAISNNFQITKLEQSILSPFLNIKSFLIKQQSWQIRKLC